MKTKTLDKISPNLRICLLYLLVWILPIGIFWVVLKNAANPMLFFLIVFSWYPLIAGVISLVLGIKNYFGRWKWLSPIVIGIINGTVFYLTYGITNVLFSTKVSWNNVEIILSNIVASAIGLVIGFGIYYVKNKNSK